LDEALLFLNLGGDAAWRRFDSPGNASLADLYSPAVERGKKEKKRNSSSLLVRTKGRVIQRSVDRVGKICARC